MALGSHRMSLSLLTNQGCKLSSYGSVPSFNWPAGPGPPGIEFFVHTDDLEML